jgi:carboxymethylenebutenolidase
MRLLPLFACLPLLAGCAGSPSASAPAAAEVTVEPVRFGGGKESAGLLARPAGEGPFPAVVLVHGDYGLDEHARRIARRLAERGYLTLAVDLYRGEKVDRVMDAHIMGRGLPDERALGDLKAAADFLTVRGDVRRGALGILGWSMGGGYALDAACADPRLRACVVCYGRLTTEAALLRPLRASVLGVFAGKDEGVSPETRAAFRAALKQAGKRLAGLHVYAKADHGFLTPARGEAAASAADQADAWRHIDAYLDAELRRAE